jgi:hypothetical protein
MQKFPEAGGASEGIGGKIKSSRTLEVVSPTGAAACLHILAGRGGRSRAGRMKVPRAAPVSVQERG